VPHFPRDYAPAPHLIVLAVSSREII
jgi:hypothetical protein